MTGLRDRWWLIVLAVLAYVGGAQAVLTATEPLYESVITFSVAVVPGQEESVYSQGAGAYVDTRAASYATLIAGPSFRQAVTARLPEPPTSTRYPTLEASVTEDTILLQVTVTDTEAQQALATAQLVGQVLPELAATLDPAGPQLAATVDPEAPPVAEPVSPIRVQVVEQPFLPDEPVSPNAPVYLLTGLLLGLLFGAAGAILLARNDDIVRRAADLQRLEATPVILGLLDAKAGKGKANGSRAQAYQAIYARLLSHSTPTPQVVLVTSALPDDETMSVTIGLARTAALSGQRVLLLGCDMRHPTLGAALAVPEGDGLTGVLLDGAPLDAAIQPTGVPGLDALPAGRSVDNPLRVITNPALTDLLDDLRTGYDLILMEAPAVLPVADAALLAARADATVVVTRLKRIRIEQLNRAHEQLSRAGATTVCAILTGARQADLRESSSDYGFPLAPPAPSLGGGELSAPVPADTESQPRDSSAAHGPVAPGKGASSLAVRAGNDGETARRP